MPAESPNPSAIQAELFFTKAERSSKSAPETAKNSRSRSAKTEGGSMKATVLTEASIDIFTAMPVGKGVLHQGSEYLTIPQVSAKTIEMYNSPTADNKTNEPSVIVEGDPSATYLPINDASTRR